MPMHMCFLGCVDRCMSMSFSGKDLQSLGTSNWQSDHYLAFTRLCLFHFAPLEGRNVPGSMTKVIGAFKRVFVLWFCLMSSVYGDEKVSSSKIDNYVKLFLSSCRFLWIFADKGTAKNDKIDTAKNNDKGTAKKNKKDTAKNNDGAKNKKTEEEDTVLHFRSQLPQSSQHKKNAGCFWRIERRP